MRHFHRRSAAPDLNLEKTHSLATGIQFTNNDFIFDNKFYHQIIGVSMGAIPSPKICDIRLYQILEKLPEKSPYNNKIKTHARFRDGGYTI